MTTECTTERLEFGGLRRQRVVGRFDGGELGSDGGGHRAAGEDRAQASGSAHEVLPGSGAERPGGGAGLLPSDRPTGGLGGAAGEHPGPAPGAHAAANAGAGRGAVHPGRHGLEFRGASGLRFQAGQILHPRSENPQGASEALKPLNRKHVCATHRFPYPGIKD